MSKTRNFRVWTTKRGYYDVEAKNEAEARKIIGNPEYEVKEETLDRIEDFGL